MTMIFGIPIQALLGQMLVGLINGSFYAMLSLGLAVIFGLLRIINFAHGALYMLGAFIGYLLLVHLGIGYWPALVLVPLSRRRVRHGGRARWRCRGSIGSIRSTACSSPSAWRWSSKASSASITASREIPMPCRRCLPAAPISASCSCPTIAAGWWWLRLIVCIGTWLLIEKTRLGSYLRAATENPELVQAFGVNVPLLLTLTYGLGAALAGLAGILAAPVYQVSPLMGSDLIIVVFAVVVIGGMGSILGAIVTGYMLGLAEGLTKVFYPEASNLVVFVIMAIVLLLRPAGLFGRDA